MYLGHVVEMGTTEQVFQPPYHPYTEALLSAVPIADTSIEKNRTNEYIGKIVEVLIEKESKKSSNQWSGRNQQNTVVVFNKEIYKITLARY